MIHPTAIIAPGAEVDSTCTVGPYAVIEGNVKMGPGCRVWPHVHITGHTEIGSNNLFHTGCVIGNVPQDLKYKGEPTRLRVGDRNVFRENVTLNLSATLEEDTVIGSNNLLMAGVHVAHNCRLGSGLIIANGALIGGHVDIQDRAVISGNCLIHQFVRIGTLAMMQGGSAISKDLPPYAVARGDNRICGLNIIGLRRAGFAAADRLELKRAYRTIFRSEQTIRAAAEQASGEFSSAPARALIDFVKASKRGVCADVSRKSGEEEDDEE